MYLLKNHAYSRLNVGAYIYHTGVGSDVVHSTEMGNARALDSGMNNK